MLNSIWERRMQSDGMYASILTIPEDEYFDVYDSVSSDAANEILLNYLTYHQDDGRPGDIRIKHDKARNTVNIYTFLYYTGNDHTEEFRTPDLLNINRIKGSME